MKCSKKLLALVLSVLVICGIGAAAVYAALDTGTDDYTAPTSSNSIVFTDVPAGSWYAQEAAWCQENGIMGSTSETEAIFRPDSTMTRAMLATVLHRAKGSPVVNYLLTYPDVSEGTWYTEAVRWAAGERVITGYDNGLFGVNDPVTREQIATILWRYAGSPEAEKAEAFSDAANISGYAVEAVNWVRNNGIMGGIENNRFDPASAATRAQVAAILYRFLNGEETVIPSDSKGAAIILNMNGTDIHARLYENTAAKAFLDLLPYTVTASRAADDLCGTVSGQLPHDPAEDQDTWAIGEIGWFDGWFTILCDNEEGMPKRTRTIIGKINDEDIPAMQALTGSVEIKVTLDEPHSDPAAGETGTPTVYFSADISPEGLLAVYEALGWTPTGDVAVKLSTGEPPASNYLRPELVKDLVQSVDGTIVECNTAYYGSRAQTAMHYQVAKDHGFTDIADFQILDEDGSMTLPVSGGSVLTENYVGKVFADYDSYLILSHFKGHQMAGYGGAIKNISIGIASSQGKAWIHSGGTSLTSTWGQQDAFLEAMAEAGKSVSDYLGNGDRIVYVNVMNRLSVDCDCNGRPAEPDIHDIGILASTDPVALDQACLDLIYAQKDGDGASLVRRIESLNGLHTLEHAEEIGLGSRTYNLVSIDD